MELALTAFGAVLPSWLLLRYFYRRDLNPEPRSVLWRVFLLGVLIAIPVVALALPLLYFAPPIEMAWLNGFYVAFACAAVPEEFFKFLVFTRYSARHVAFNEPMDGIVYGAVGSLGFATLENILYVAGGGWVMATARAFTAVPMHAFLGAILGYYVGRSHLPGGNRPGLFTGLGVAILLHGLYDFPLLTLHAAVQSGDPPKTAQEAFVFLGIALSSLVVLGIAGVWTFLLVRRARREQLSAQAATLAIPPSIAEL